MKLLKNLATIAIATSMSVSAFAQSEVETRMVDTHVKRLQTLTLAALIKADYTTLKLPESKIESNVAPSNLRSSAMVLGTAGFVGGASLFIIGLRKGPNELSMILSLPASLAGAYSSDTSFKNADATQKQMDAELVGKMKTDYKINAQVSKALAPWIGILNLDANQASRLKVAVKNDLIAQTQKSITDDNVLEVNVLNVAVENKIIDIDNRKAVTDILTAYLQGTEQQSKSPRSEAETLETNIQIAQMNISNIEEVLHQSGMPFERSTELRSIVNQLKAEIAQSQLVQGQIGK